MAPESDWELRALSVMLLVPAAAPYPVCGFGGTKN